MQSNDKAVCASAAVEALLILNETVLLNVYCTENSPRNICHTDARNKFIKDSSCCMLPLLGNEECNSRLPISLWFCTIYLQQLNGYTRLFLLSTKVEVTVRLYCLNNKELLKKKKKKIEEKFYHASLCKGNYNKYKIIWKMKIVFHHAVNPSGRSEHKQKERECAFTQSARDLSVILQVNYSDLGLNYK